MAEALHEGMTDAMTHGDTAGMTVEMQGEMQNEMQGEMQAEMQGEMEEEMQGEMQVSMEGAMQGAIDQVMEDVMDDSLEEGESEIAEFLTDEEVIKVSESLSSKRVDDLVTSVMSIEKVLLSIKAIISSQTTSRDQKDMLAVISVEQAPTAPKMKDQVVVVNVGEKELELTDMITKDGKLRRKKAKKQMSSEEIKEKLRKLRESRDDIPMKTCEQCGYRTREPYKMRRHERTHTGEKPFKCPLCPFRGAEKSVVVKHLKSNVHSKKSSGNMMKPGTTGGMGLRIDCDQCTFTATSSQQMIKHKQNRHEGLTRKVGKLRCPFCDYRNSYQKVMDLHIKAHEEEGTSKPIIANTTETEADADGIVTVFLNDLVSPSQEVQPATTVQSTADVDGVDELLTSINS